MGLESFIPFNQFVLLFPKGQISSPLIFNWLIALFSADRYQDRELLPGVRPLVPVALQRQRREQGGSYDQNLQNCI